MNLLIPNSKISQVHGQSYQIKGRTVVPMYHPAAALHQGSLRPVIQNDFALLPKLIAQAEQAPQKLSSEEESDREPKQLSLF